jgi:hypothetical protein
MRERPLDGGAKADEVGFSGHGGARGAQTTQAAFVTLPAFRHRVHT